MLVFAGILSALTVKSILSTWWLAIITKAMFLPPVIAEV